LLVCTATAVAGVKSTSAFVHPAASTSRTCGEQGVCTTKSRAPTNNRVKGVAKNFQLQAAAKGAAKKAKKSAKKSKAASNEENFKKSDFVAAIAEKTGFTKTDSEEALNAVLDTLTEVSCLKRSSVMNVVVGQFTNLLCNLLVAVAAVCCCSKCAWKRKSHWLALEHSKLRKGRLEKEETLRQVKKLILLQASRQHSQHRKR
jgi:hypothetical protein